MVFVTGQREVQTLCNWLTRAFPVTVPTKSSAQAETIGQKDSTEATPRRSNKTEKRRRIKVEAKNDIEQIEEQNEMHTCESEKEEHVVDVHSTSRFNLDK